MIITALNPLIIKISGYLLGVVFYQRYGKQCARIYVIPRNPDTGEQRKVRYAFADAVKSWQSLTQNEKFQYNRKARYMNMSGYNLFISRYMKKRISQTRKHVHLMSSLSNLLRFPSVSCSIVKQFIPNQGIKLPVQCYNDPG